MAKLLKLRRGTTSQHSSFTGAEGEVTVDTDKDVLVVNDGSTAGGHPLAAEDMSNVSSASIAGQLGTDSIATSKIAAGALPTDVTVSRGNIVDGEVTNSELDANAVTTSKINNGAVTNIKVSASAGIHGSKITPNFGSQTFTAGNATLNNLNISSTNPYITFTDTDNNSDFGIFGSSGLLKFYDNTNAANRLTIASDGTVNVLNNLDVGAGIDVTGNITTTGNMSITNGNPNIALIDSNNNPDYEVKNQDGLFKIKDTTNSVDKYTIASSGMIHTFAGNASFSSNLDVGAGVDVTGNITATGDATISGGDITINGTNPTLHLTDSDHNPDWVVRNDNGVFKVRDFQNNRDSIVANTDGHIDLNGNVDISSGLDVTGNITVTGTVDGRDVSADGSKLDGIESGATADQTAAEILNEIKTVDGSGSGLDADNLDGRTWSEGASNSTIVSRNSSGYIFANYLNTTANNVSSGVTKVMVETGDDNYIRHGDAAAVRTFINVENGATADQSASEIVSLVNGQSITPANVDVGTGRLGSDSTDYFAFANNSLVNLYINNNNEFRFEADGDFHADGDVIAYSTTTASDENLKKDITIIPDSLAKVEALKGVTFKWNKNDQASAGVIAQDVQKVLPEVVREVNDFDGSKHLAVNYSGLTSILIEAVKELSAKVKVLEAK